MVSITTPTTTTTTTNDFPQLPDPKSHRVVPQALAVGGIRSKNVDKLDARIWSMRPFVNVSDPESCVVAQWLVVLTVTACLDYLTPLLGVDSNGLLELPHTFACCVDRI